MVFAGAILLLGISLTACAEQSSPRSSSPGSRPSQKEAGKIVSLHNQIRADVGVGPVRWSEELAGYAQQWADHLTSSRCGMEHRPRSGKWRQQYGENLFIGTAGHYGTADAVMAWAEEKSSYRGGVIQASRIANIGHYTQMVWRNTRQIGCGTGVCRGNLIVVCNYDPPGNFLGQRPY
jgi:pathogenesis-related protein 1